MSTVKSSVTEILRKAMEKKATRVSVSKFVIRPELNVREPDVEAWQIPAIASEIKMDGQKVPVLAEQVGEDLFPIQGFRRTTAIRLLAERGEIDPITGKPFDTVLVWIVSQLTEKQRVELMVDSGNTLALNPAELFYVMERLDRTSSSDAEISITCRGLMDKFYPVKREIKDDADYINYRRGLMQNFIAAIRGPVVMRDAFVLKLKREQSWPTAEEARTLYKAFKKEKDADKTAAISSEKPGAEWLKTWAEFVDKKTTDAANGTSTVGGGIVAFNRDAMVKVADTAKSRTLRVIEMCHLRKVNEPEQSIADIDEMLTKMEKGEITPAEIEKILNDITAETEEVVSEAAAA